MTHLTAERRVRAIFYWAHVLGTKAEIVVEEMRIPAQVAVATLQVLLIATRGHRSYTESELNTIFLDVGQQFFTSLEQMASYADRERLRKGREASTRNHTQARPPMPFKRLRR